MRALPNMKVIAPTGLWEAAEATKALAAGKDLRIFGLDKGVADSSPRKNEHFGIGRSRVLRDGRDVSLIATGAILSEALVAGDRLAKIGIEPRVISMHTVKPLDVQALLRAATETRGIVTIEEGNIIGGLGSAVAETLLEAGIFPRAFARIGLRDIFPSIVGDQNYLRKTHGLTAAEIELSVIEMLGLSRGVHASLRLTAG